MGKESEINNSTIVSILEEILPTDIETEWVKMITTKGNEHTLFFFYKQLHFWGYA